MKELPTVLGIILVCGYCVILIARPAKLARESRAVTAIKQQAESKLKSAIEFSEQALQPFIEELAP